MAKIAVVGAGIAGLVAARVLQKAGHAVRVFEASEHVGGKIDTEDFDGAPAEWGPQTLMASHDFFDELVALAGVEDRLREASADAKNRYVWYRGACRSVPTSLGAALRSPLVGPLGVARVLLEPLMPRNGEGDSVRDFFARRLGARIADRLIDPFVSGVWAGDASRLQIASAFPKLAGWVRDHGSLLAGALASRKGARPKRRGLVSFEGGLSTLTQSLADGLIHTVDTGRALESLTPPNDDKDSWTLDFGGWTDVSAEHVVLALPSREVSRLVRPFDAALHSALLMQPVPPVAVVQVLFPADPEVRRPRGFGALVGSRQIVHEVLGVLFVTDVFPRPDGQELFTVFLGGRRFANIREFSDSELSTAAIDGIRRIAGFTPAGARTRVRRHDRAIPQYEGGQPALNGMVQRFHERHSSIRLVGNWCGGISVLDSARHAAQTVSRWETSQ